jgi:hypothetical protein
MDAMTLIFGIASIVGAGVSIWQACVSKNAAQIATAAKAQIVHHRKTSELTELQALCRNAQKSMEKYGHGSSPASLKGVSQSRDAVDVQDFLQKLIEYRSCFGSKNPNDADEFVEKMNPLLDEFARSTSKAQMRELGAEILTNISIMFSIIKKPLDSKKETVH